MVALLTTATPLPEAEESPNLLDEALRYASKGRPVLPLWWPVNGGCACEDKTCEHRGKHPIGDLVEHGVTQASTDLELIRRWWTKFPAANIGLRVGDRNVVLDFDSPEAQSRFEAEIPEPLPKTPMGQTGRGSHVWLSVPEGVTIRSGRGVLGKDIDIKTGNQFVVAPPSLHFSGRRYFWISRPPIAPCPAWLLDRLTHKDNQGAAQGPGINPKEVLAGVPEGQRDDTLFRYACSLRARGGVTRAEAESLVLAAAGACTPPFNEQATLRKVEQAWKYPERQAAGLFAGDGEQPEGLPETAGKDSWLTPPEVLREIPDTAERLKTGIATLDDDTRGGIPPGSVVVVGGPPGVGKTALVVQLATRWAVRGEAAVVGLFADEGRDAASTRIGQSLGLDRRKLETKDPATLDRFTEAIGGGWIFFPDPDEVGLTFESLVESAKARTPEGRPLVFVVDSVQTVRSAASGPEAGEREQIKDLMAALRKTAKRERAIVLVSSQVNRLGFRHQKKSENTIGLASFTGSSAIEYGNDLAIFLDGDPETVVTARLVKNRLGNRKATLSLAFDFDRATFSEIDRKEAERAAQAELDTRRKERLAALAESIVSTLAKYGPLSGHALREKVGGKRDDVRDATALLEAEGRVRWTHGPKGARVWTLVESLEAA